MTAGRPSSSGFALFVLFAIHNLWRGFAGDDKSCHGL
jgi:hypothetical protein